MIITTKYLGPTNTKGARVVASSKGPNQTYRRVIGWDYELEAEANHTQAARALADSIGVSHRDFVRASTANGFVFVSGSRVEW